jgi:cysteine-rich repeat protein
MKKLSFLLVCFLLNIAVTMQAAEVSKSCDIIQGFNFQDNVHTAVGYINSLEIKNVELSVDFTVADPLDPSSTKKVVGVISSFFWDGNITSPLEFAFQVSNSNKVTLSILTQSDLSSVEILVSFDIYEYDTEKKRYYKSVHSNNVVLMAQTNGEGAVTIDPEQSPEVMIPKNFAATLTVEPQWITQEIHMAVSVADKFVKWWGIDAVCGNGNKEGLEECDDGNTANGDGCSSTCRLECIPEPEICDGKDNNCNGEADEGLENCHKISLNSGWNLISLNIQPASSAIAEVLSAVSDSCNSAWAYNNGWTAYYPAYLEYSDLGSMEAGWGYWLNMNAAGTLIVNGSTPTKAISLVEGWNLVGCNSPDPIRLLD